jgi:hypothetical protein
LGKRITDLEAEINMESNPVVKSEKEKILVELKKRKQERDVIA